MHLLALCVLQNSTVVNVNQDLHGPKALCPYDLPGPGCTIAAVRVEQDLQEEKKNWVASCLVFHTHWRVVRFTEGVSALAFSINKTNSEFKGFKKDLFP